MSTEDSCIFCRLYAGKEKADIIYKDDEVIAFSDIRPAATHHYLIITRVHISDAKCLTKFQKPLIETLVKHANRILLEKGADLKAARLGFHWPPFHSVRHLHLHAISPVSEMSFLSRWIFKPQSFWFVTPEYVLERLNGVE